MVTRRPPTHWPGPNSGLATIPHYTPPLMGVADRLLHTYSSGTLSVTVAIDTQIIGQFELPAYVEQDVSLTLGHHLGVALRHRTVVEVVPLACRQEKHTHIKYILHTCNTAQNVYTSYATFQQEVNALNGHLSEYLHQ